MKKWWLAFLLCLLLPAAALAVTEGVVEAAPQVAMDSVTVAAQEISYLPDESYYAGYGDWNPAWENAGEWVESEFDGECYYDVEQRPRMTAGEAARAKALLEKVQAGEIAYTGESILNKMEDVIVGVYALNPDDYDGEAAYVLLPGPCMTDEQILAVIDAYAQLGLTFDPDALSVRNCARGGGIETNRFLVEEERARYQNLARLIERGLLDVSAAGKAQAIQPKLDNRYFCGLPDFTIRPYRAATDEEFVAMLLDLGYRDLTGEIDHDGIERESRAVLNSRLGAALSMELSHIYHEGGYVPVLFDGTGNQGWTGSGRRSCGASLTYHTPDGILVYAYTTFDWETKELVNASVMHSKETEEVWPEEYDELTHGEIMLAIEDTEKTLGLSGLTWHDNGEETWTNWGACRVVRAMLAEGEWLTLFIGQDDAQVHGMEIQRGRQVDQLPEDDMPVNG